MSTVALHPRVAGARVAYGIAGTAALAAAWSVDGWSWTMLLAGLAPDVPLLLGPGQAPGRLHPRAVPSYNATHSVLGPLLTLVVGGFAPGAPAWLTVVGLTWAAHVFLDRALGYGPRRRDGWRR